MDKMCMNTMMMTGMERMMCEITCMKMMMENMCPADMDIEMCMDKMTMNQLMSKMQECDEMLTSMMDMMAGMKEKR